jgi:pilus assembly protein CpaB
MKWSVVALLILGLVAAACAALLVLSLEAGGGKASGGVVQAAGTEPRQVSYAVAARDLDVRAVVESDAVRMVTAESKDVPPNTFAQPAEVIGQVLRRPMKQGQAFDRSSFTAEGTGVVLAGALREGKRAVSLPVGDSGGIESLLYPGCMVDVLATLQLKDEKGLGEQTLSMTLLQGIYVLAVGDQTVVTPSAPGESRARATPPTVTLLVDSKQAEMLYLARQRGSVSIVLRNPTDTAAVGSDGTRLPNLSPVLAEAEERNLRKLADDRKVAEEASSREREKAQYDLERARQDIELARKQAEIARIELDRKKLEAEHAAAQPTAPPQWETRILRGGVEEVKKFDMPSANPVPKPQDKKDG